MAFSFLTMYNRQRNSTYGGFDPMRYGFGIDVGGTTVKLAYFNEQGAF